MSKGATLVSDSKGLSLKIGRDSYPEILITDTVQFGDLVLHSNHTITQVTSSSVSGLLQDMDYKMAKFCDGVRSIFRKKIPTKPTKATITKKTYTDTQRLTFMVNHRLSCMKWHRNGTQTYFEVTQDYDLNIAEGKTARQAIDNAIFELSKAH